METASEGGPWGIALLASYLGKNTSLPEYITGIFNKLKEEDGKDVKASKPNVIAPTKEEVEGFEDFMKRFKTGLPVETSAIENL